MKVIIAAAGTAGHINPGLAIANKIKKEEPDSEIIFVGTTRGLENDLVPKAGYKLKTINAYGLSKKISIENFKKILKTIKGLGEAKKIVKEFNPDIVIGAGGYICGAVVLAAKKYNKPVLLHESNAFPGKAVKMLAKKSDTILVSFNDAKERIPNAKNVVYSGTPVKISKKDYSDNEKKEIIQSLGLDMSKPIILVFGGSQGAQKINEAIIDILNNNVNKNYQIIWAAGPKQYDIIKKELKDNVKNASVVPYIYNMEQVMNISDVIVARSGAMTISEISNLGKPSILIPLPNVSNDHQLYNAKVLENVGAAKIILNNELNAEILNTNIENILKPEMLQKMGYLALTQAKYDAEDIIYDEVKKLIKA